MNALVEVLVGLPFVPAVLLKSTLLLTVMWPLHFALLGQNPRLRVLLWRGTLTGLVLLPITELTLPALEVALQRTIPSYAAAAPLQPAPLVAKESPPQVSSARPTIAKDQDSTPRPNSYRAWAFQQTAHVAVSLWAAVVFMLLLQAVRAWARVRAALQRSAPAPDAIVACAADAARRLGIRPQVEFRVLHGLGSPFLTGIRHSVIVLPERGADDCGTVRMRAILAHELAHVKTHDTFWTSFASFLSALLWFHPLIWGLRSAHGAACEEVCDAVAAEHVGGAEPYSQALANEALAVLRLGQVPGGVPMLRSAKIIHRLRRLEQGIRANALARRQVFATLAAGAAVLSILGSLRIVQAEPRREDAIANREPATSNPQSAAIIQGEVRADADSVAKSAEEAVNTPRTLRFRVIDETGAPLPGLRFVVYGQIHTETVQRGVTDAEGRYAWKGAPPETAEISISHPTGALKAEVLPLQEAENVIIFETPQLATIRGKVLDATTEAAVAEYDIWIGTNLDGSPTTTPFTGTHWDIAKDSERKDGAFELQLPKKEPETTQFRIAIVSDGYFVELSPLFPQNEAPNELVFKMEKAAPVEGRILDRAGAPVSGAKVHLASQDFVVSMQGLGNAVSRYDGNAPEKREDARHVWFGHNLVVVSTPSDGRFKLPALRPPYSLVALNDNRFTSKHVNVPEPNHELRLEPCATLTIDNTFTERLTYLGISPAPEKQAWFYVLPTHIAEMQSPIVVMEHLPPGRYVVHPSYHAPEADANSDEGNAISRYITLAAGEDRRLSTLEDGPEVSVGLSMPDGMKAVGELRNDSVTVSTSGIASGMFRFYTVPPGQYRLTAKLYAADTPENTHRTYTDYEYPDPVLVKDNSPKRLDLGKLHIANGHQLALIKE